MTIDRRDFLSAVIAAPVSVYLSGCSSGDSSDSTATDPFLGAKLSTSEERKRIASGINLPNRYAGQSLPQFVDLSSKNRLPAIGQQERGDCVAWGIGYSAMTYLRSTTLNVTPTNNVNIVSQADLYAKMISNNIIRYCNDGPFSLIDTLNLVVQVNIVNLNQSPYLSSGCSTSRNDAFFKIAGYTAIDPSNRQSIKEHLANDHILVLALSWPRSLSELKGSGVYAYSGDQSLGGHCVTLVGYDESRTAYKIMNSHGQRFGQDGFGWMSYSAFEALVNELYYPYSSTAPITPSSTNKPPSIQIASFSGASIIVGQVFIITVNASDAENALSHISLQWADENSPRRIEASGASSTATFSRTLTTSGTFQWQATAFDTNGNQSPTLTGSTLVSPAPTPNVPPSLGLLRDSGTAVQSGVAYLLTFTAQDTENKLAYALVSWNDVQTPEYIQLSGSSASFSVNRTFTTPQQINWSATVYDLQGSSSSAVTGTFVVTSAPPINPSALALTSLKGWVLGGGFANALNRYVYFELSLNETARIRSYQVLYLPTGQRNYSLNFDWGKKIVDQYAQIFKFDAGDGVGTPSPNRYYRVVVECLDGASRPFVVDEIIFVTQI